MFLGMFFILTAILLSFSDKIIEHFIPNSDFANIEEETDEVIFYINDQNNLHAMKVQ